MRRPLIAAATAAVALALLPAAAVSAPTARGVDITPPAVGSCHALTLDEGMKAADPDPDVPCTDGHTSITIKNIELSNPDYSDGNALLREVYVPCYRAMLAYFGDGAKALQMSAYTFFFFAPTKAQQEAGATWLRCDLTLRGGTKLMPLPTNGDPKLGSLPHGRGIARCRLGEKQNYTTTVCTRPHEYKATYASKYPSKTYPGQRKITRWTIKRCQAKLGRSFGYYSSPGRLSWRAGLRYSVCERH